MDNRIMDVLRGALIIVLGVFIIPFALFGKKKSGK